MQESQLQALVRQHAGLRVGQEMAEYLLKRIQQGSASVRIIGADARTGIPLHRELDLDTLPGLAQALGHDRPPKEESVV